MSNQPSENALAFAQKLQQACLLDINLHDLLQDDVARLLDEFASTTLTPELRELVKERQRQNEKWGEQNHSLPVWMLILTEEVGEAAEAVLNLRAGNPDALRAFKEEIIHCGAVCVQILEYLERGKVSTE
jgi:NTP pyrophosphatase (non-canonical NTP hydrolase)